MNKKHLLYLALVVLLLVGGAYISQTWFSQSFAPRAEVSETATSTPQANVSDIPTIPGGAQAHDVSAVEETAASKFATYYSVPVSQEGTVLEAMNAYAATSDFSFSGREFSGLGLLVEEIGELENMDGYYWSLYINGELSELGVSSARVYPGDTVEWRYQKGV